MGELVSTINNLMLNRKDWTNKSIEERRNIVLEFEERVKELSVTAPYNTDDEMIHWYGDNTYGREINIKAGVALVGAVYKQPQINILLKGVVFVVTENVMDVMKAPLIFTSDANTNKVGYVLEDMQWITVMSRNNGDLHPDVIMRGHVPWGG